MRPLRLAATLALLAMLTAGCGVAQADPAGTGEPPGVQTFQVPSRAHVQGTVQYPQDPPVGGPHNPVWMNCGFYSQPVTKEMAVHSMEHGAVWITYTAGLPADQVAALRALAARPYVLASPYPGLDSAVVASAWGKQLRVDGTADPRLQAFVELFAHGPQTPEPHAPCEGGFGEPE